MNERDIFDNALALTDPAERAEYLDHACGGDARLREHMEGLLAYHGKLGGFLESPAVGTAEAPMDHPASTRFGDRIGPYKLREQIGEGGMGVVYVAEQSEPVRRKVALKIIRPGLASKDVVVRFEAERQALAMMDHPNIARVFDGGATDSGQPYFVMELVQGLPITDYCDEHRLSTAERLKLFVILCEAVQHSHQRGVIHRDLKPTNVLVPRVDGKPVPKVIDFGVAKAMDQKLTEQTVYTQFAQMVGTPLYMSPEQTELGVLDVDTRCDVYGLGVMLYELSTGSTPFDSETLKQAGFDEMRRIIREDEPPRPSARVSTLDAEARSTLADRRGSDPRQLGESLKGELDWIVMKALEKDRNRRYQSAGALAEDIERYLHDEPIAARPASHWYRATKFIRRNLALVASLAAIFVALFLGFAIATVGLLHALEQQDLSKLAEDEAKRAGQLAEERAEELAVALDDQKVLTDVLGDMYPRPFMLVNPGRNRTVYESIEELTEQINNGRLSSHPRVEIEVRIIFADSYFAALEFDKFRDHLYKALVLARQEYGEYSFTVASIHERLAYEGAHNAVGVRDPDRLLKHAEKAIEIYERLNIRSVHAWVGKVYALQRWPERHDEAIAAAKKAIELDGEYPVHTYVDLGDTLMAFGDRDHLGQALECFEQAIENHELLDSPRPSIRANLLSHQARCLRWLGELAAARDAYREAHDLYQASELRAEPKGHGIGLQLADLHFAMGNVDEAFALVDKIEDIAREHDVTSSLISCLAYRGWLYFQLEEFEVAVPVLQEATSRARKSIGTMRGLFGLPCLQLALSCQALEPPEPESAARQYQELRPFTQSFIDAPLVKPFVYWAHAHGILATCNGDPKQLDRAEDIAEEGLKSVRAWQQRCYEPAFHVLKAMIQHSRNPDQLDSPIAELQVGLGKAREPRSTHLNSGAHQVPTDRWHVEAKLVEYLLEDGRTDEARHVMTEAVKVRRTAPSLGPGHIQTVLAEIRFGEFLLGQKEFDAAASLLEDVYEATPLSTFACLRGVRRNVAALLVTANEQRDDAEEADRWKRTLRELTGDERGDPQLQPGV